MSFETTSIPAARSACPTRVVPAKRSAAVRAPIADAPAAMAWVSARFDPRYLITGPA